MKAHCHANLLTYLNDHWAGSVGAVALIEDLLKQNGVTALHDPLVTLRTEIESDQQILKDMIRKLGGDVDGVKSVSAWFAEKVASIKLRLSHDHDGPLGIFEAFEILTLGIEGKRLLWVALDEYKMDALVDPPRDLTTLQHLALTQSQRVQQWRLVVGRTAFLET